MMSNHWMELMGVAEPEPEPEPEPRVEAYPKCTQPNTPGRRSVVATTILCRDRAIGQPFQRRSDFRAALARKL